MQQPHPSYCQSYQYIFKLQKRTLTWAPFRSCLPSFFWTSNDILSIPSDPSQCSVSRGHQCTFILCCISRCRGYKQYHYALERITKKKPLPVLQSKLQSDTSRTTMTDKKFMKKRRARAKHYWFIDTPKQREMRWWNQNVRTMGNRAINEAQSHLEAALSKWTTLKITQHLINFRTEEPDSKRAWYSTENKLMRKLQTSKEWKIDSLW